MVSIQNKVAFLIPYFGPFQWYTSYFLHTCKFNLRFDFIFITDMRLPVEKVSNNIVVIRKTFTEIRELVRSKLGPNISLEYPYKICDFRPAYGIIFSELLTGYKFWGHIDDDVILGDLKKFIPAKVLKSNDIITLRHDYLAGCCTLYKNVKKINSLYTKSRDYAKIFAHLYYLGFDETNFNFIEFTAGLHYSEVTNEYESMTQLVRKMQECHYLKSHFEFCILEDLPGRIKWQKGKVVFKNKYEAALYHMIQLKKIYTPTKSIKKIPDAFYISKKRIYR